MQPYETFPPGSAETWLALIEKELGGPPPAGLPQPFYMRADVPEWETLSPLSIPSGWALVAERFIPDEVGVWLYDARFIEEGHRAREWIIAEEPSLLPSWGRGYQLVPLGTSPVERLIPVWEVPLQLSPDLEVAGGPLSLPPDGVLHIAVRLDQRVLHNVLLLRALRLALLPRSVTLWAWPKPTLYEPSGLLPTEGPEENLIRATLYALGSVLGGAQYLYIPPILVPEDVHAARWSRAISHILRYEVAYLYETSDPLAGSFYLEAESHRIAEHIRTLLR